MLEARGLPPRDLVLVLDRGRLRLSADPDAPRFHLEHGHVERHAGPLGPFFRRVADELPGATLLRIEALAGDRVARLELGKRVLVLELFGRRSNLLLLDEAGRLLEALVPPPEGTADPRLSVGNPWRAPERKGSAQAPAPSIAEAFPHSPAELPGVAPLSWIVERSLGAQALAERRARAARDLAARVERRLERARSLARGLEVRLEESGRAERVRQDGELLKGRLQDLRRGAKEVLVEDSFEPGSPPRRIELDPRRTPQENLERIFERARKLERAHDAVRSELALARERERELAALLARVGDPAEDLDALAEAAIGQGLLEAPQEAPPARKREAPAPRLPYKRFTALRGSEIRVGRSARDNDELTFRHARGLDLWLHTADAPGSHVVLCLEKGQDPDSEELVDAAHLAAHFSPLRGRTRVRVHVARRKEVHKPRGAKPGLVTLSGGRILDVRMQPERLQRLLGARHPRSEDA